MAADIQKGVHLALRVTHHEDRVFAHIRAEEVTGLRDLALVAQEQPAAGKNLLQLLLVDLSLDEDAPADQAFVNTPQPSAVRPHDPPPSAFACLYFPGLRPRAWSASVYSMPPVPRQGAPRPVPNRSSRGPRSGFRWIVVLQSCT